VSIAKPPKPRIRPVFILAILLLPGIYLLRHGAQQGWFPGWSGTGAALRWGSVGAGHARTRPLVLVEGIRWDARTREFRVEAKCRRGVARAIRAGRLTPVASVSGSWMLWPVNTGAEIIAITHDWKYVARVAPSCPPEGEAGRDAFQSHMVRHVIRISRPAPISSDTEGLEVEDLVTMEDLRVSPEQVEGGGKTGAPHILGASHDDLTVLFIARSVRIVLIDGEGRPAGRPSGARIDAYLEVPEAMHLLDWESAVPYPGRQREDEDPRDDGGAIDIHAPHRHQWGETRR
jgi:hypothetical protein